MKTNAFIADGNQSLVRLVQRYGESLTTKAEAEKAGYAGFNNYPHLCIDLPPEGLTITCKTQEGKRVTFSFVPYEGGKAGCCDIQYHDSGESVENGGKDCPSFHMIGFTPGTSTFDTRKPGTKPTTLATVLLSDKHYAKGGAQ